MHFFIYNPYSIVKETLVAETNAGGNRLDCFHRLSRGHCFIRCVMGTTRRDHGDSGAGARLRRVLVAGKDGGADRDRTDDPLLAKQMLSQLSYSPGDVSVD